MFQSAALQATHSRNNEPIRFVNVERCAWQKMRAHTHGFNCVKGCRMRVVCTYVALPTMEWILKRMGISVDMPRVRTWISIWFCPHILMRIMNKFGIWFQHFFIPNIFVRFVTTAKFKITFWLNFFHIVLLFCIQNKWLSTNNISLSR